MSPRNVFLLGPLHIQDDANPPPPLRSQRTAALLAYLVAQARPVPRNALATLLWPDADLATGRANLRRELHNLNRILPGCWQIDRQAAHFVGSGETRIDLDEVRRLDEAGQWREAAAWLRGGFMAGLNLDGSLEFETWLSGEREHWRQRAQRILLHAAAAAWRQDDAATAQQHLTRLLALSPWHEAGHRELMRLLARQGQFGAALKQFERCRALLAQELDVAPAAETAALARRIRAAAAAPPPPLPPEPTRLVGRGAETAALVTQLLAPHGRLLTLTGLGGIGKSRLALHLAHTLGRGRRRRYLHGAAYACLTGVAPDALVAAVASALQLPLFGKETAESQLVDHLQTRELLLVLDDCEPTPAAARLIQAILAAAPDVTLLVTARAGLNLQQEWLFPLGGLPPAAAADLFRSAARRKLRAFDDEPHQAAIAAICHDVDGMPLALVLAASWVDVLSPADIATALRRGLDILETDAADLPPRQRSVRAALALSWQRLDAATRAAAVRLCPMRGPFTRQAALQMAAATPVQLRQLIGCAFLHSAANDQLAIHSLVRQFLAEQADAQPAGAAGCFDRHMPYYLARLAADSTELRLTLSAAPVRRIRAAWPQMEAAWWRAVAAGRMDLIEACIDVVMLFEVGGFWGEGLRFLAQTQAQLPADCVRTRARLDGAMSLLAFRLYDLRESKRLADRALAVLGDEIGADGAGVYAQLSRAVYTYLTRGRAGYADFVTAVTRLTTVYFGCFGEVALLLLDGARDCRFGAPDRAAHAFQEALRRIGPDSHAAPNIRCMLGLSYLDLGEADAARAAFRQVLPQARALRVIPALVGATVELRRLDAPAAAQPAAVEAGLTELAAQVGSIEAIGRAAIHVGVEYLNFGRYAAARQLFRVALRLLWKHVTTAEFASASFTVGKFLLLANLGPPPRRGVRQSY